jgi:hypothetical protein
LLWALVGGGLLLLLIGAAVAMALLADRGQDRRPGSAASASASGPGVLTPLAPQGGTSRPGWIPDPAMLGQLGSEAAIENYRFQPPPVSRIDWGSGFAGLKSFHVLTTDRAQGEQITLQVSITPWARRPAEVNQPLDRVLQISLKAFGEAVVANMTSSPTQHGRIAGMAFVRARYEGTAQATGGGRCAASTTSAVTARIRLNSSTRTPRLASRRAASSSRHPP